MQYDMIYDMMRYMIYDTMQYDIIYDTMRYDMIYDTNICCAMLYGMMRCDYCYVI